MHFIFYQDIHFRLFSFELYQLNEKISKIKKSISHENILKTLGPGILFASTAIGVSHLVQSTKAGALFGLDYFGLF